ncbi:sensor histidine kinase [Nocardiopsis ansamitocini]|uniref:histidine kinase n=1 Tax=Nocardiopsis ansamitocini TaxID=1670832 RepID=A0A9W6UKW6_9ACTN|nr:HAMP domain-containing sensor histidine kinase [Nocardiopsis ansamitocini]GLU50147.1 two-component sensor histidine kinase [Nocardiopsis ansamitocini]
MRRRRPRTRTPGPRPHNRLSVRLMGGFVLVAVSSVTATAWVAVQGTSGAILTEQGQTLADDTRIYDELLGYAATHSDWADSGGLVSELADDTGRRITLTTQERRTIADSAVEGTPLRGRVSSVLDPLAVDAALVAEASPIDSRAVGPFALTDEERAEKLELAEAIVDCLTLLGVESRVVVNPSGRPGVDTRSTSLSGIRRTVAEAAERPPPGHCVEALPVASPLPVVPVPEEPTEFDEDLLVQGFPMNDGLAELALPTTTERDALEELNALFSECVGAEARTPALDLADALPLLEPSDAGSSDHPSDPCVESARRELLGPFTAPAALLFISDPVEEESSGLALSREGMTRIVGLVAVVLALAVGASIMLSSRLTRPLRILTDAVQRVGSGEGATGVSVSDRGEIGQLAEAFNNMSHRLARLERQRKDMISDISHELRTPLANIRSWLEAAQDGLADLDHARRATLIGEALLLQRLIDDLQDLAQADAGKLRLYPEPVDMSEIVAQVVAGHRRGAESGSVNLAGTHSGDVTVSADPSRMRQALGNLVSNALRHTPPGGRVTVRAFRVHREVVVEVEDTGEGIASDHLPLLFDRFWRADKSRSRRTGGSGLGLAIVRQIVELHGGRATAASTPGEGSVFTLALPADTPEPVDTDAR